MKKTMQSITKRLISMLLVLVMVMTMLPAVTMEADADVGAYEMFLSDYWQAMEYLTPNGTLTDDQRWDALWGTTFTSVGYGDGLLSGLEKTSDGLPNVAKFKSQGLVCASYAAYVLLNYLPNVKGIDTSRFTEAWDSNNCGNYQYVGAWDDALDVWEDAGLLEARYGSSTSSVHISAIKDAPMGTVVFFRNANGPNAHVAIYLGYYNGDYYFTDLGDSNGPKITRYTYITQATSGKLGLSFTHAATLDFTMGKGSITKKTTSGQNLDGYKFQLYSSATGLIRLKTNTSGQACVADANFNITGGSTVTLKNGTYTFKELLRTDKSTKLKSLVFKVDGTQIASVTWNGSEYVTSGGISFEEVTTSAATSDNPAGYRVSNLVLNDIENGKALSIEVENYDSGTATIRKTTTSGKNISDYCFNLYSSATGTYHCKTKSDGYAYPSNSDFTAFTSTSKILTGLVDGKYDFREFAKSGQHLKTIEFIVGGTKQAKAVRNNNGTYTCYTWNGSSYVTSTNITASENSDGDFVIQNVPLGGLSVGGELSILVDNIDSGTATIQKITTSGGSLADYRFNLYSSATGSFYLKTKADGYAYRTNNTYTTFSGTDKELSGLVDGYYSFKELSRDDAVLEYIIFRMNGTEFARVTKDGSSYRITGNTDNVINGKTSVSIVTKEQATTGNPAGVRVNDLYITGLTSGGSLSIEVKNIDSGTATIKKTLAAGTTGSLSGYKFQLTPEGGTTQYGVTKADGKAYKTNSSYSSTTTISSFSGLKDGKYTFTEVYRDGYCLQSVEFKMNGTGFAKVVLEEGEYVRYIWNATQKKYVVTKSAFTFEGYDVVAHPAGYTVSGLSIAGLSTGGVLSVEVINAESEGSAVLYKRDGADKSKKLSGAVFDIYTTGGNHIGTMEEVARGEYRLDDLAPGQYYLEETVAPWIDSNNQSLGRYPENDARHNFAITGGEDTVIYNYRNGDEKLFLNYKKGNAKIIKYDMSEGEASAKPVAGFEFEIYSYYDIERAVFELSEPMPSLVVETDANGEAFLPDLEAGQLYYIREVSYGWELQKIRVTETTDYGGPRDYELDSRSYYSPQVELQAALEKLKGKFIEVRMPDFDQGISIEFAFYNKDHSVPLTLEKATNTRLVSDRANIRFMLENAGEGDWDLMYAITDLMGIAYRTDETYTQNLGQTIELTGPEFYIYEAVKEGWVLDQFVLEVTYEDYVNQTRSFSLNAELTEDGQFYRARLTASNFELEANDMRYNFEDVASIKLTANNVKHNLTITKELTTGTTGDLEGFVFALYNDGFCLDDSSIEYVAYGITDKNGVVHEYDAKTEKPTSVTSFCIPSGEYCFAEMEKPGYHPVSAVVRFYQSLGTRPQETKTFDMTDSRVMTHYSGLGYEFNITVPDYVADGGRMSVEVTNAPDIGSIDVYKLDLDDGAIVGAVFKLVYSTDNGDSWNAIRPLAEGEAEGTIGTCSSEGLTDSGELVVTWDGGDGIASFEGLWASPDILYQVIETQNPPGFTGDYVSEPFVLEGHNSQRMFDVYNTPLGSIEVLKLDLETNAPLAGATFILEYYDVGDEEWYPVKMADEDEIGTPGTCTSDLLSTNGCLVTDENGVVVFEGLHIATNDYLDRYRVREVEAPEGYLLSSAAKEFSVDDLYDAENYTILFTAYNMQVQLPPMGGNEVSLFVTTGIVLIGASAFVYIFLRKRKKHNSGQ